MERPTKRRKVLARFPQRKILHAQTPLPTVLVDVVMTYANFRVCGWEDPVDCDDPFVPLLCEEIYRMCQRMSEIPLPVCTHRVFRSMNTDCVFLSLNLEEVHAPWALTGFDHVCERHRLPGRYLFFMGHVPTTMVYLSWHLKARDKMENLFKDAVVRMTVTEQQRDRGSVARFMDAALQSLTRVTLRRLQTIRTHLRQRLPQLPLA